MPRNHFFPPNQEADENRDPNREKGNENHACPSFELISSARSVFFSRPRSRDILSLYFFFIANGQKKIRFFRILRFDGNSPRSTLSEDSGPDLFLIAREMIELALF